MQPGVKGVRATTAAQQRSAATRARILAAAEALFAEHGYAGTTLDAVADDAGVAVQTVKFVFHTKAQLLLATIDGAAVGPEQIPVVQTPWYQTATTTADDHKRLALIVEHGTDIYARLAPLTAAIDAAAALDADIEARRDATAAQRRRGMAAIADAIVDLHPTLTAELATDALTVLQGPVTFHQFTAGCQWPVTRWKAWQYRLLCNSLLARTTPAKQRRAAIGLSFGSLAVDAPRA